MVRRTRAEMEKTRAALLAAARDAFAHHGYAEASMDALTAQAGLTRGALYHHFGDKPGLLAAVVAQIDAEMDARLHALSESADTPWTGLTSRCRAYLEMALEPEIQQVVLRDARIVLGGASAQSQRACIASMQGLLESLMAQGVVATTDPQALAALLHGSLTEAAVWIATGDDGDDQARLARSLDALDLLLRGLLLA
ncbi:TetR/AcrR family transcriptional regulator [Luteimonas sp. TWI662]|uniref:TetR/AcrR family transcriptional regulator n=1 Tax=Luteimonas sp. TWI662 TaxID=3136789 RepID=UPI00320B2294